AREASEDPGSAPKGGDLGWVRPGEMVPQFEQGLFALKKGEISPEPVRTPFGFHAVKVLDVRAGGKKPLKDAAAPIRDKLQAEPRGGQRRRRAARSSRRRGGWAPSPARRRGSRGRGPRRSCPATPCWRRSGRRSAPSPRR